MSGPVSILVPTYARTALLAETVESFLRRREPAELVIINDCPLQTLTCNAPGVRIYNHAPIANFGTKRHRLTQLAYHDLMCVWDDDDIYLPDFLTHVLAKLRPDEPAAKLHSMWSWDGTELNRVSSGVQHATVFRRADYETVGGWPALPAESADATFWANAQRCGWFRGRHHHEEDWQFDCIYRVGRDRPQMEGGGLLLSEGEYKAMMDARIERGDEPGGTIEIVPGWTRDWLALANTASGKAVLG